jgi:1-acyl-sn-glycerol-3-phosphate acyltransferase
MSDAAPNDRLYRFCRFMLLIGLKLYNRVEFHGRERIPKEGGCVIAANHCSFLDPPVLGCVVDGRPLQFMARNTLFRSRWFGALLRGVMVIPLSREKGDIGALKTSISALKKGRCIGLFPEGTRSPDGELKPAKSGIGFLVSKAGVPVVPVYIDGSYKAFRKHGKWIHPAKIRAFVGEPISPRVIADLGSDREAYRRIGELIMARIDALKPK